MSAMTERSLWVKSSAKSAPTPAEGSVDKIVTGESGSRREPPRTM